MTTPQQPLEPGAPRPVDADLPPEPIGSTQQFQAFAARTDEEDERAGEQLAGPDIPDVIPEDPEVPEDSAFADPQDDGYPAAPSDQGMAPSPSGSTPLEEDLPAEAPPVRSDRGRALVMALAVVALVVIAGIVLFVVL